MHLMMFGVPRVAHNVDVVDVVDVVYVASVVNVVDCWRYC